MILESISHSKRYFNTKSKLDVSVYKNFLVTSGWGRDGCPFIAEKPFHNVPDMIKDKLVKHFLKVE